MATRGIVYSGTSGWSYKHWKGPFYPEHIPNQKMLPFYFQSFQSVEINSSFYHLPLRKTFENWRDAAPEDFVFAVKASRFITHVKKLTDTAEAVQRFFERASGLGRKIGPVLFQLPPGLKINPGKLRSFLDQLPPGHRYSFEFRNTSWFHPEIFSLLRDYGAAFCIYELGGRISPIEVTAGFVYVRLHGPGGPYQGCYSREALTEWSIRFARWARESRDVYCYFDNDQAGFAAQNALELQEQLAGDLSLESRTGT
jgi:uncharacterized protein YecE (DUF72 family)